MQNIVRKRNNFKFLILIDIFISGIILFVFFYINIIQGILLSLVFAFIISAFALEEEVLVDVKLKKIKLFQSKFWRRHQNLEEYDFNEIEYLKLYTYQESQDSTIAKVNTQKIIFSIILKANKAEIILDDKYEQNFLKDQEKYLAEILELRELIGCDLIKDLKLYKEDKYGLESDQGLQSRFGISARVDKFNGISVENGHFNIEKEEAKRDLEIKH